MLQSIHIKNHLLLQHPQRQVLLEVLQTGPQPLENLARHMYNVQQAEHHLKKLLAAGVVRQENDLYQLDEQVYAQAMQQAQHPLLDNTKACYQLLESSFPENGVLKTLPSSATRQQALLEKLVQLFETGHTYTEKEVNQMLAGFTRDVFLVRRSLIDAGLLERTPNGSQYWRP